MVVASVPAIHGLIRVDLHRTDSAGQPRDHAGTISPGSRGTSTSDTRLSCDDGPASLLLVSDILRRRRSAPDFPGGPNNAIGGFQGGDSHARHAHTGCGRAPA